MADDRDSKGRMTAPLKGAQLFTSKTGKDASDKRWEKHNENSRQAIIEYASGKVKQELSFAEAYEYVVSNPQFLASEAGKTAAAKFVREEVGLAAPEGTKQITIDKRQINVYTLTLDRPE
ncbi:hypothetical protein LCGC14_1421850, partial [marine sediment metagenome]